MSRINWPLIEKDYIENNLTYRELEARYKVSCNTICYHSKKENWRQKREAFRKEIDKKLQQKMAKNKADEEYRDRNKRIDKFKRVVNKGLEKILSGGVYPKSEEGLLNAIKNASEHIELLEGGATDRIDIKSEQELKDRLSRLRNRLTVTDN